MLHVYVLLVALLSAGRMAQTGADQHEGRVAVRETPHYTGAVVDIPAQPFNHYFIGAVVSPAFAEKTAVSQRFLYAAAHQFLELHLAMKINSEDVYLDKQTFNVS